MIKDVELSEKYTNFNKIWKKVSNHIKKGFDSEPVYNERYLKTKLKSHEEKIDWYFHSDKMLKEVSQCICLLVILNNLVYRAGRNKSFRRM